MIQLLMVLPVVVLFACGRRLGMETAAILTALYLLIVVPLALAIIGK